jgi:uncharacterized membrane protein
MALALIWVLAPAPASDAPAASAPVSDSTVRSIVQTHCLGCHARHPSQPGFQAPPAGIVLEQPAQWLSHKAQILQAAVATQYMPLGNLTGMTEQERQQLGQWLNQTH